MPSAAATSLYYDCDLVVIVLVPEFVQRHLLFAPIEHVHRRPHGAIVEEDFHLSRNELEALPDLAPAVLPKADREGDCRAADFYYFNPVRKIEGTEPD
ncbi:MAG: hypothetical protein WCC97_01050 [Candidatus Acidiferrales bacterium]